MDVQSGQRIHVRPGPRPAEQAWQGCYASPQLGPLALAEHDGGAISGRYAYTRGACRVQGELSGRREGNLARFELRESTEGCPGWQPTRGQGFLFYTPAPNPDQPSALLGERSYLRVRQVSRDRGILEPYDPRRVTALKTSAQDACEELEP